MIVVGFPLILIFLLAVSAAFADVRACACDVTKPESLEARECSLCQVAEQQHAEPPYFFLKDINPRKANRWLALPRVHYKRGHSLAEMSDAERTAYWTAAMGKAKELFGDSWGLAVNGEESRTQCHGHIHIGRLLDDAEKPDAVIVDGPGDIPVPQRGMGLWVHPVDGKLHVHTGEQINEFVLQR